MATEYLLVDCIRCLHQHGATARDGAVTRVYQCDQHDCLCTAEEWVVVGGELDPD